MNTIIKVNSKLFESERIFSYNQSLYLQLRHNLQRKNVLKPRKNKKNQEITEFIILISDETTTAANNIKMTDNFAESLTE